MTKDVNVEKVQQIKELIQKAQAKAAKAEGVMESIQKEWKAKYGIDTPEEAKKKLGELQEKVDSLKEKQEKAYKELLSVTDWEDLEMLLV